MRTLLSLLRSLEHRGVRLSVDDGEVRYRTRPGALSEDLRAELVSRKSEIIEHLGDHLRGAESRWQAAVDEVRENFDTLHDRHGDAVS